MGVLWRSSGVLLVVLWVVLVPASLEALTSSRTVRNSGSVRSTTAQPPVTVTPSATTRNFTGRGSRSR
ncbi:hypothetical protein LSTR_LSTR015664 [Laodelphax striatellus]|uniref:Uncharacterized protein n=1 Tax=Laodelphax striatellus TaxID=195883 RepID=A0A482WU76_LAOST|nr:hypothetical protein LSTR_LSTR015664 [Laodelphax striatellus]